MKIARIVYEWPPPWAGLAPAPYEITKSQTKKKHEVTIFCARWPRSGRLVTVPDVNIHHVWRAPLQGTVALTSAIHIFFKYRKWRKRNTPDIIHAHGHFGIWIYLYRNFLERFFPWSKELKTPMVMHFHNTVKGRWEKLKEEKAYVSPISRFLDWPLAQKADKWALKGATACIFVSEKLKQEAIKYYKADPERCFVIESGVNIEIFRSAGSEEKQKTRNDLNLDRYDKVILNLGIMVERKNIHTLIESLRFLPPEYKLMLLGPDGEDDGYKLKLLSIIDQYNLEERVIRVGYTPYPQVPIAFQMADIFVLPSSFEGFPKVALEALATGIPVLASGFEPKYEVPGFVKIEKADPENLAAQIKAVVTNPPQVNTYKVMHLYSWDVKAAQIDKVYEFVKKAYE
ncbi:glycosyltransferase family 4 protein [Patescibacteria group bacterium]